MKEGRSPLGGRPFCTRPSIERIACASVGIGLERLAWRYFLHWGMSAPAGFGRRHVAPLVPLFRDLHPDVTISLNLSDRVVDLAGEGFDCAVRVGLLICEDAWHPEPARAAAQAGAQLLAVINASPFHEGKQAEREATLAARACETGLPLVYAHLEIGRASCRERV